MCIEWGEGKGEGEGEGIGEYRCIIFGCNSPNSSGAWVRKRRRDGGNQRVDHACIMTSLPSEDHSIKGAPSERCDGDGVKVGLEVAGRDQRRRRPHEKLSTSRSKAKR